MHISELPWPLCSVGLNLSKGGFVSISPSTHHGQNSHTPQLGPLYSGCVIGMNPSPGTII